VVDRVVPLTPDLWPAFEKLFGKSGACMGCWCMYWRLPRKEWEPARGAKAKAMFKRRVSQDIPPGVVAFDGEEAVGWLQIGPRADAPQWNGAKRVSAPERPGDADDERVWATTCFFVKSSARGQGVMEALLKGALQFAKANGARVVEACPIDGKASVGAAYVGRTHVFERAKFREVARRKPNRPLMRLQLKPTNSASHVGKKRDAR
jgi:predicted GNAT family acetyltransferase